MTSCVPVAIIYAKASFSWVHLGIEPDSSIYVLT